jgi:xylulokinase
MSFLGIDVGTTRIKALVYDSGRRRISAERDAETPVRITETGEMHEPDAVLDVALDVAAAALADADVTELAGISVTSMGEEVVLYDSDGGVVGDVLTWYNPRGRDLAPAFLERAGADLFGHVRPDPMFSLFKFLWLADERPDDLGRTVRMTDMADHLLWRLGGGDLDAVVMDWSHASRTGFFDLAARGWDRAVIAAAGLDAGIFPRLVPSGARLGTLDPAVAARLGVAPGAPLVSGGHDHFCAAYAVGVRQPGSVFISAGTSEAVLLLTDRAPSVADVPVDAGCFVDDELWYLHQPVPSGHVFRQWRPLLYAGVGDEEMWAEVAALAAADDLHCRCTIDAGGWSVTFADVQLAATRAHLMRALLEALARDARTALDRLERLGGHAADEVVITGRATGRREWLDLRTDAFERPLVVAEQAEATALGAALLAQRGVTGQADEGLIGRATWPFPSNV